MNYQPRDYESIQVLRDGTPLVQKYSYSSWGQHQSQTFSTLDGQQVQLPQHQQHWLSGPQLRMGRKSGFQNWYPRQLPVAKWFGRIYPFTSGNDSEEFWYFVGYHRKSKQLLGYLNRTGFQAELPKEADRFPLDFRMLSQGGKPAGLNTTYYFNGREPYYSYGSAAPHPLRIPHWRVYLLSKDNVVEVDLKSRTVKTVLK
jgi:hypothetical protein